MNSIIQYHLKFYMELKNDGQDSILNRLTKKGIHLLDGFIRNQHIINSFYNKYYVDNVPRIVLCGINPGRNGAGKTGVPFLDFLSLSKLLPNIDNDDKELSAQFLYDIILHFGAEKFFKHLYLTNVSWFGFTDKKGNNVNYYELEPDLQVIFTNGFVKEMETVKPSTIIPLSKKVEFTLKQMKLQERLPFQISPPLGHPYYYSNFITRRQRGIDQYVSKIEELIV